MHKLLKISKIIGITSAILVSSPVWAEAAPVYDVEAFEVAADHTRELPLPPPPSPENSFVPEQSSHSSNRTVSTANMGIQQRVQRVEQQVANMQNSDTPMMVESLQNQIKVLRGQVEELTHQLEQVQTQQKSMYADVDKRLTEVLATSKAAVIADSDSEMKTVEGNRVIAKKPEPEKKTSTAARKSVQPDVAEEQKIYQTAYDLIKARKYSDAVDALQGMLKKYPSGQFASNAHYWLGELYGLMGQNEKALDEFAVVLKEFPNSPRVSDAQLKIGLILAAQSQWASAKKAFRTVINKYPGTASSRLASEQLKQIKSAGH